MTSKKATEWIFMEMKLQQYFNQFLPVFQSLPIFHRFKMYYACIYTIIIIIIIKSYKKINKYMFLRNGSRNRLIFPCEAASHIAWKVVKDYIQLK